VSEKLLNGRLEGISAMPVTPFADGDVIDEACFRSLIVRLVEAGIETIIPAGHVGEYTSLLPQEILQLTKATVAEVQGNAVVLAGVGGDLSTAVDLARKAVRAGADGVMIHSPHHPFLSDAGLDSYYEKLANATDGAVAIYIRERSLSHSVLERLLALPNVVAIKYGLPDVVAFAELVRRYAGEAIWICGLAELWAPSFWLVGARGFTSGLVNVQPDLACAMLTALRAGDYEEAMRWWQLIAPFEYLRIGSAGALNVSIVKEAMAMRGLAPRTVRPPLSQVSLEHATELAEILAAWDLSRTATAGEEALV
jgi:4-hydroxy-tetrahydrodipicolinate synthase